MCVNNPIWYDEAQLSAYYNIFQAAGRKGGMMMSAIKDVDVNLAWMRDVTIYGKRISTF